VVVNSAFGVPHICPLLTAGKTINFFALVLILVSSTTTVISYFIAESSNIFGHGRWAVLPAYGTDTIVTVLAFRVAETAFLFESIIAST
jgi:hypothetical protein